jgi:GNAT superfamily N-acetyltransferase
MSKTSDTSMNFCPIRDREHEVSKAERAVFEQDGVLQGKMPFSRLKTLETSEGILFLRDFCSPQLVESLRADRGLNAFTRLPEREHQLLLTIAKRSDSVLTLAYTSVGEIVGEVTLAPVDSWWADLEHAYEIAIQVSPRWRRLGVARHLLTFALEQEAVEEMIILAMGLSWHWDIEGVGIGRYRYRQLLAKLFTDRGFAEYLTTEPNITMDPANVFLARIGKRVKPETMNRFFSRLLNTEDLME